MHGYQNMVVMEPPLYSALSLTPNCSSPSHFLFATFLCLLPLSVNLQPDKQLRPCNHPSPSSRQKCMCFEFLKKLPSSMTQYCCPVLTTDSEHLRCGRPAWDHRHVRKYYTCEARHLCFYNMYYYYY